MATKKPAATSTAVAIKPVYNLVSIRDQLKAQVAAQAGKTEGGAKKVKFDRTTFTLPNGSMFQAPMRVVVLDFNTHHNLFEKDYVKGEVSPIICASLGDNPKAMSPYASIADPQCGDCNGCWANEFKSAKGGNGNGKACKQVRTMAVMVEDAEGKIDPKGPIFLMQTNVTANKVFDAFVKSTGSVFQLPPVGVVVSLGIDSSNPQWNFATYDNPQPMEDAEIAAFMARQPEARGMLTEEITVSLPTPAPVKAVAPARGKTSVAAARR
jgi:hypothetical protein